MCRKIPSSGCSVFFGVPAPWNFFLPRVRTHFSKYSLEKRLKKSDCGLFECAHMKRFAAFKRSISQTAVCTQQELVWIKCDADPVDKAGNNSGGDKMGTDFKRHARLRHFKSYCFLCEICISFPFYFHKFDE